MERIGWTIRFDDKVWRESDLTLGQAGLFEDLTKEPWPRWPIASASQLLSLMAVFLADGDPSKLDEALGQLAGLNMVDALAMVTPGEE